MVKVTMKRTTKHGQTWMREETPARRKLWKQQRRKWQRHNDRKAVAEF